MAATGRLSLQPRYRLAQEREFYKYDLSPQHAFRAPSTCLSCTKNWWNPTDLSIVAGMSRTSMPRRLMLPSTMRATIRLSHIRRQILP